MKKNLFSQLKTEDWVIVAAGAIILTLSGLFPQYMPTMPKTLSTSEQWYQAGWMFIYLLMITLLTNAALGKKLRGTTLSLFVIFALALCANVISSDSFVKELGLETVFFSVILGLFISNVLRVPEWLKPAIQSEFYIKIGIVCLGSTIIFSEVMKSGVYGLVQSLVVVFLVWNFAFWIAKKMKVDSQMSTMLASAVSICGVSAAIATCGVIKGDNKKLSYVISLVLVCAIPMMYLMPWLSQVLGLNEEVAGAWIGGTIDTTGAVAASGTMLGEVATQTAIIVKSSQNVLLGVAAFAISVMWSYKGEKREEKPTLSVIWERFPKFVVGFILASLVFSFLVDIDTAKSVGKLTKGMTNVLFGIAFVCIGLETRFSEIFSKENRRPLWAFLTAQGVNVIITLIVSFMVFGMIKAYFS
ncbi:MAG: putative sulfate exporter family transporter [Flavobacteriales bacterium]|nr:putative sulfate exporter family transporter [Flavobacteriales bacterium]